MHLFKSNKQNVKNSKNIFIVSNKSNDIECVYLDKSCIQPSLYSRLDNNILKNFFSYDVFEWESYVYLYLISNNNNTNIVPQISSENLQITYYIPDFISFRTFLSKNNKNINFYIILNELFSFIRKFKKYKFIHGNLTIDNVFIDIKLFNRSNIVKFYIVDYSNSYILSKNSKIPKHSRTSFMGEYNNPIKMNLIEYWDFYTIYLSLLNYYKNNKNIIHYIDKLSYEYITYNNILKLNKIKNNIL